MESEAKEESPPKTDQVRFLQKNLKLFLPKDESVEDRIISLDEIEHGIPPLLRVILRLTTHQISGLFDTLSLIIDKNDKLLHRCAEWIFSLLAAQGNCLRFKVLLKF